MEAPATNHQFPELFLQLKFLGIPQYQNSILQELLVLYLRCMFNIGHHVSLYTKLQNTGRAGFLKSPGDFF